MAPGGARPGAGRPKGQGPHGEATKPVRIPLSMVQEVNVFLKSKKRVTLPLYSNKVPAGFPSPADDHIETRLDLNTHLIRNPAATFLVRVSGDSMNGAGIQENDILVVDRSLEALPGKIVIAVVDGYLTVKRLVKKGKQLFLMPENPDYQAIELQEENSITIWGVVTYVIHGF